MKKFSFLLTALLAVYLSFGQVFLTQDFSSGQMPPTGWTIDGVPAQWSAAASAKAGGSAPEAKFSYINQNTTSRLVSPVIDLTGNPNVTLAFKYMYDYYSNGPKIGVATRFGTGAWTTVWEITPTGNVGPESKFLSLTNVGQSNFQLCFYITGNLYNVDYWYIDDIMVYNPLALDAKLVSVNLPNYLATGSTTYLTGKVTNIGTTPITSFDIVYTIDGGAPQLQPITGLNMQLGDVYDFTHNIPIVLNNTGSYAIVTTVENVNAGTDLDPSNNSLTNYVGIVPYIPQKKVFCEEATGTWCGWCVRGICFMDYMAETYPETWIGVAVHNGDPMVNTAYDNAIPSIIPNFPGYPSGTIDRSGGDFYDPSDFEAGYLQRINAISPATIDIENFGWDPLTRQVTFDLQSDFVVDVNNELRFCAVIAEDSLYGTGSDWDQANYYSGGGNGPMCGFENLSDPIPAADMHYDHVAREILDSPYGTQGSLPATIPAGSTQSYTYTYTIPQTWNYDKLHFIGLLIDMGTGEVLNANNVISSYVGVEERNNRFSFSVYPNPVTESAMVSFNLEQNSNVRFELSDMYGSVVYSEADRNMPAGANQIKLQHTNLASGMYVARLIVNGKSYTRKIAVLN